MTTAAANPSKVPTQTLRSERDRFVALAFCWADILLELDGHGTVMYAAGALKPLIGKAAEDVVGSPVENIVAPADRQTFRDLLAAARKRERIDNAHVRLAGANIISQPMAFAGYQLQDLNGHFFVALRHSPPAKRATGFGKRTKDEETGLYDGDSFIDMVTHKIAGDEDCDHSMSLIMLPGYEDLRKRLVETAEHELLAELGAYLREQTVDGEAAARLGVDRFGVVHAPDVDVDELRSHIAHMTKAVDPLREGTLVEAATFDLAAAAVGDEDVANGIVHAINRFRNEKGSDFSLQGLSSSLSNLARDAIGAVKTLKEIIANKDFEVAFQPIVNTRTGAIHHFEALARFPARYGNKSPFEHITLGEETGLISEFDLAMVEKLIDWMRRTQPLNSKTMVAVNISGFSVGSLSYLARFTQVLKANPWLRGRLIVEITESSRMFDLASANDFVQRLREQNIAVCLDDFGTGAANFQYLAVLDVDLVKVDGTAIQQAQKGRKGKAFMTALVGFCRELGIRTVAEMVEDEAQLTFARECGFSFVQGYLMGKPAPEINGFAKAIPAHLFPQSLRTVR
jgi:EAL domain-containing protein (putative c-di-GMP-specific phosphodiesterase class I)/GGDEF domain-containing protein